MSAFQETNERQFFGAPVTSSKLKIQRFDKQNFFQISFLELYTGCLRNYSTGGRVVILRAKISRKEGITFFHLTLHFQEKCV